MNSDYHYALERIKSACKRNQKPNVSLSFLDIDTVPSGLPDHVNTLDICDTRIADLSSLPTYVDNLIVGRSALTQHDKFGGGEVTDIYLHGNVKVCKTLQLQFLGSSMHGKPLTIHLKGMPQCDFIYDSGNIQGSLSLNFTGLDITTTPKPTRYSSFDVQEAFEMYYERETRRILALHGSNDEASLGHILSVL